MIPEEVAERLAVSPQSIRQWLRVGKLKRLRAEKLWRIRKRDLEGLIRYVPHGVETTREDDNRLIAKDKKPFPQAERPITVGKAKPWEQVKKGKWGRGG